MTVPTVGFFGLKGGSGKTTLVYHLAWMLSDMGVRTLAVDLDPQSALTEYFFGAERAMGIILKHQTIHACFASWSAGGRDVADATLHTVNDHLAVIAGDLRMFGQNERFYDAWRESTAASPPAAQGVAAIATIVQRAAVAHGAQIALIDMDPSISGLNYSAFAAISHLVTPIAPEPLSVRSLQLTGVMLSDWRDQWEQRRTIVSAGYPAVPAQSMFPIGYVIAGVPTFGGRPTRASQKSLDQIPGIFHRMVDETKSATVSATLENDPMCLARIHQYNVIFPMAAELNKPVFHLQPADGAMGGIMTSVVQARRDFDHLARAILSRVGVRPQ